MTVSSPKAPHRLRLHRARGSVLLLAPFVASCAALPTQPTARRPEANGTAPAADYSWRSVVVGGGGYVTGIVIHPKVPDQIYIRTDVGGLYKWNTTAQRWLPLLDSFPRQDWHLYGVESVALHPENPQILYAALGKYLPRPWLSQPSGLYRSEDGGTVWRKLGLPVPIGGNENFRWVGERLAIDPSQPKILYYGSRTDGLWKSDDEGQHFSRVASFPATGTAELGLSFVLFDGKSSLSGQPSQVLFVGVAGEGIFRRQDAGVTWARLGSGPFPRSPQRAALATDGVLYVTSVGDKTQPGGVYKLQADRWFRITPTSKTRYDYGGISVDPSDPGHLLVAPASDVFPTPLFESHDRGASWQPLAILRQAEVPWWPQRFFTGHTSSLLIDPHRPSRVFLTDYYGTWKTNDVYQVPSSWSTLQAGHEEVEPFVLRSPPAGVPLLSGVADVDGFRHEDLDAYPKTRMIGPKGEDGDTTGLDFCEANPSVVMRVGEERGGPFRGARSEDGAASFVRFATLPFAKAKNGRIVLAGSDCQRAVWVPQNAIPSFTSDGGKTWKPSQGAPKNAISDRWDYTHPLASDRTSSALFYLFLQGAFYVSSDGGQHFQQTAQLPAPPFDTRSGQPGPSVKTTPGVRGQVFVCLAENGLFRSDDAGLSFHKVAGIDHCQLFALGRPAPGSSQSTLFVYGIIGGVPGIFRSEDLGLTYLRIDSPSQPIGDQAMVMEADPRVFGRVYIGTNGRGTFYGQPR